MIIYKTTNLLNNKIYIGQDKFNNPKYLGSGKLLNISIKKHGIQNFKKEILEECNSKKELNEREIFWIKTLKSNFRDIGYNISKGGDGGDIFTYNPNKEKIRENWKLISKEINNRPEIKEKIRNKILNLWKTESYRNNVLNGLKKSCGENWKLKLSIAMKKVKHNKEWNEKVGDNNTIRYHVKKIKYFLENGLDINILVNYFNVKEDKILSSNKEFKKEPDIEILLNAYYLYINSFSINFIRNKLADAPSKKQLNIFFALIEKMPAEYLERFKQKK